MHIRFLYFPWELRGIQAWSLALITLIKHICIEKISMSYEAWTNRMRKKSCPVAVVMLPDVSGLKLWRDFFVFPSGLCCVHFLFCWLEWWADACCWEGPSFSPRNLPLLLSGPLQKCCFPLSVSSVVPFDLCCAQLFFPLNVPLIP